MAVKLHFIVPRQAAEKPPERGSPPPPPPPLDPVWEGGLTSENYVAIDPDAWNYGKIYLDFENCGEIDIDIEKSVGINLDTENYAHRRLGDHYGGTSPKASW